MKKVIIYALFVIMSISIYAINTEIFNPKYHYSGKINICLSKELLGNTKGEIKKEIINGVISTPDQELNELFKTYNVFSMNRLYRVKDKEWNRNGVYPMNIFQIEMKDESLIQSLYKELGRVNGVVFAEFDPILKINYVPNDNMLYSAWHIAKVDAYRAWNYETGNSATVIGIVDSGVKWNHPDLRNNMWVNEAEMVGVTINNTSGQITGGDGIDNDNNGFIDDIFGWDFYATGDNEDNNPYQSYSGNDHGTHVAGCAAEVGDNQIGTAGPAYNARIMSTKHQPSNMGTNYIYNGYSGIYYCADSGADIINCSWGGAGGSEIANTAATYAKDHGALLICAASNDNTDNTYMHYYPSDAVDGVSVAATDAIDVKASFSNYGTPIDVSSPGVSILSTVYTMEGNNGYSSYQGTSMASPVASGVAALIKSMYPELTPLELRERLKMGCDNIDSVNPTYIGKLGAGRINAYNSLMYDKLPNISLKSYQITEIEGNMDGNVNPGETVSIKLNLKNRVNWLVANNLDIRLRTENSLIALTDSLITINTIASGDSISAEDTFTITVSPDFPVIENANFIIHITANSQNPYVYNDNIELKLPITCMKTGWPYIASNTANSPLVEDINNDGEKEIIFNDSYGKLYVVDKHKNPLPGFPLELNEYTYAAPSILVKETGKEIVFCTTTKMYRISATGAILSSFNPNSLIRVSPVIVDQNGDGDLDIIFGTINKKVYIFEADGQMQNSYSPVSLNASVVTPLAVGKDGTIYLTTNNGYVQSISNQGVVNQASPFPYYLGSVALNGPVVLSGSDPNNYQENIIVAGNRNSGNKLALLRKNCSTIIEKSLNSGVNSGPIFINQGSDIKIVFGTYERNLNVVDSQLNYLEGFPVSVTASLEPSPLIIDINGDNQQDFMFTCGDGSIRFIDQTGQEMSDKRINLNSVVRYTPLIGSFEADNKTDLLVSSGATINYLDLSSPFYSAYWTTYRYDNQRTGRVFGTPITEQSDNTIESLDLNLSNYPNPFNPNTSIRFNLAKDSDIALDVYNVKGQLVKNIHTGFAKKGQQSFMWNGTDTDNKSVSSGIYFYRLHENGQTHINKMILVK